MFTLRAGFQRSIQVAKQGTALSARWLATSQNLDSLSDNDILSKIKNKEISIHKLESLLSSPLRAIAIRRQYLIENEKKWESTPLNQWDSSSFFNRVVGHNCECIVGYVPIPLGIVGPIKVNGEYHHIPMATTEGALIASTNRGARAISESGGTTAVVVDDGMTRAPVFRCESVLQAAEIRSFLETPEGFKLVSDAFSTTTKHGVMKSIHCIVSGNRLHMRLKANAGDAMGMNMLTKGSQKVADALCAKYPTLKLESLSGNMCTDKKPSAANWLLGRGKSVTCEVRIPESICKTVLKCAIPDIIRLNTVKNHVGSSLAGTLGGNNAHAANIVAAIFLATGQDMAQVVESSHCLDFMEETEVSGEKALYMSVTMPCIEVGTIGGGTSLAPQHANIELMRMNGEVNSVLLSELVASTVLAGELSLMAAQVSGDLVKAHEKLGHILLAMYSSLVNENERQSVLFVKENIRRSRSDENHIHVIGSCIICTRMGNARKGHWSANKLPSALASGRMIEANKLF